MSLLKISLGLLVRGFRRIEDEKLIVGLHGSDGASRCQEAIWVRQDDKHHPAQQVFSFPRNSAAAASQKTRSGGSVRHGGAEITDTIAPRCHSSNRGPRRGAQIAGR
jgi:hypothetical protein